jgi:hypothetical protein
MIRNYYGAANFGFYALVIRDENFAQLCNPFPYYADARPEAALKNFYSIPFFPLLFLPSWNWSYEAVVSGYRTNLIISI